MSRHLPQCRPPNSARRRLCHARRVATRETGRVRRNRGWRANTQCVESARRSPRRSALRHLAQRKWPQHLQPHQRRAPQKKWGRSSRCHCLRRRRRPHRRRRSCSLAAACRATSCASRNAACHRSHAEAVPQHPLHRRPLPLRIEGHVPRQRPSAAAPHRPRSRPPRNPRPLPPRQSGRRGRLRQDVAQRREAQQRQEEARESSNQRKS